MGNKKQTKYDKAEKLSFVWAVVPLKWVRGAQLEETAALEQCLSTFLTWLPPELDTHVNPKHIFLFTRIRYLCVRDHKQKFYSATSEGVVLPAGWESLSYHYRTLYCCGVNVSGTWQVLRTHCPEHRDCIVLRTSHHCHTFIDDSNILFLHNRVLPTTSCRPTPARIPVSLCSPSRLRNNK